MEPEWTLPVPGPGGWYVTRLRGHGSDRLRCEVAVSRKGEISVRLGELDYPGAAQAIAACYESAMGGIR